MHTLIFIILTMLVGINQDLEKMVEIKFEGKFVTGRGPCQILPDGTRRWPRTTGFNVIKLFDSEFDIPYVEISYHFKDMQNLNFELGQVYIVTINLTPQRLQELKLDQKGIRMTYKNPIRTDEIIELEKKE